jgi:enamine deaminase RidA (YjgF/YER057c/UK114 family)
MAVLRRFGSADVAPAVGYAHAVEVSNAARLVFLSGQVPVARDGSVPDGAAAQARQVWSNILAHLAAAGMTVGNIVKVTVYLADGTHRAAVNEVCDEVMGDRVAAWTTVVAGSVRDDWLVEIEAIAAG